jgi:hypothetical protein
LDHLRKAIELDPTMATVAVERGLHQALWEDEVFRRLVENAEMEDSEAEGTKAEDATQAAGE